MKKEVSGYRKLLRQTAGLIIVVMAVILLQPSAMGRERTAEAVDTLTARRVFTNLPLSVLDLLGRSTRLDMLDYYDADSLWQAPNTLGGKSVLERVAPDYLSVRLTPVSTLQICILPQRNRATPLVMTLYTIGGAAESPDTEVRFFDSELKPVDSKKYFTQPELRDFISIPKGSKLKRSDIESAIPFATIAYIAVPGTPFQLMGRLTVGGYLSQEDRELVAPFLKKGLKWEWTGTGFRL